MKWERDGTQNQKSLVYSLTPQGCSTVWEPVEVASAENEIFIKSTLPSLKSEQTLKLALPPYPPIQSRVFDTSSWKGSFQP